jgi:hypothetical protein
MIQAPALPPHSLAFGAAAAFDAAVLMFSALFSKGFAL